MVRAWRALGEELGLQLPGLAVVARAFAGPAERAGRDLRETPAHGFAGVVLAVLNNVGALGAADLARVDLAHRIPSEDVPGVDAGIVDAQRRAVEHAGKNSHVLDGATFERPAEMDFARPLVPTAVVAVDRGVHGPGADQPAVELELVGAIRRRAALCRASVSYEFARNEPARDEVACMAGLCVCVTFTA